MQADVWCAGVDLAAILLSFYILLAASYRAWDEVALYMHRNVRGRRRTNNNVAADLVPSQPWKVSFIEVIKIFVWNSSSNYRLLRSFFFTRTPTFHARTLVAFSLSRFFPLSRDISTQDRHINGTARCSGTSRLFGVTRMQQEWEHVLASNTVS